MILSGRGEQLLMFPTRTTRTPNSVKLRSLSTVKLFHISVKSLLVGREVAAFDSCRIGLSTVKLLHMQI